MVTEREFYEALKAKLERDLEDSGNPTVMIMDRGNYENMEHKLCIAVTPADSNSGMRIKAENYYDYEEGHLDYEGMLDVIRNELPKISQRFGDSILGELDRNKVIINLVNENRYNLDNCPHRDFCGDVKIMYRYLAEVGEDGQFYTVVVNDFMMERLGIESEEELYDIALSSTLKSFPAIIEDVADRDEGFSHDMFYYIGTGRACGASAIIYPDIMDRIREYIKGDFFVFPFSDSGIVIMSCDEVTEPDILFQDLLHLCDIYCETGNNFLSEKLFRYNGEQFMIA